MRGMILALAGCTIGLWSGSAAACSCAAPPSPQAMIDGTEQIFRATILSGTVTSTQPNARVHAVASVVERFKGDATGAVVLSTALQSATCGVPLTLGQTTVFFTSRSPDGGYGVNLCSQLPYDSDRAAYDAALSALSPSITLDSPIRLDGPIRIVPLLPD